MIALSVLLYVLVGMVLNHTYFPIHGTDFDYAMRACFWPIGILIMLTEKWM